MEKKIIVHTLIEREDGKVLITRRAPSNDVLPEYWDIPGGSLEDGEDPAEGAAREAKEETGLTLTHLHLFFHHSNTDTVKNKQYITLVFRAHYIGEDIVLNPEEHDEFAWIAPEQIGSYKTVVYLKPAIAELQKKTR